ncbi:MAG: hypothetical protein ACUVX8_18010, partial [Candidatus Zipacnadales bacterium]
MSNRLENQAPVVLLVAVFLVSAAVICFEIALTRCFSVLLRYHYVFLIISIATFGLGAGGVLDYALLRPRSSEARQTLTGLAILLAPLPAVTIVALFRPPVSHHLTNLWLVAGVSMPTFLVAGAFLSCVWRSFPEQTGRLYAADLAGAAIGSVAVISGLQFLGGTGTPMVTGALVGVGAIMLAGRGGQLWRLLLAVLATLVPAGLLTLNLTTSVANLPAVPPTTDRTVKTLYQELSDPQQGARIVYTDWNAFARTDVVQYHPPNEPKPWEDLYIYTDGDVPTNMKPFDGDLQKLLPDLEHFIGFLPFRLQRPERVLLIGPGGGLDILVALVVGVKEIDGVELNPSIPRIMRRYAKFNGGLYDYANVNIAVAEGRSYLMRAAKQYDLIYMALPYSATTPGTGGLALVESYLHTVEAMGACLQRLTPQGQIVFVCGAEPLLLRAFLTALEALEGQGKTRTEALHSLAVIDVPPEQYPFGAYRHMLLIRQQPFSLAESQELGETALAMGLWPGYCPGIYEPVPFSILSQRGGGVAEIDAYLIRTLGPPLGRTVAPVTDDRPFFADLTVGLPTGFATYFLWGGALLVSGIITMTLFGVREQRRCRADEQEGIHALHSELVPYSQQRLPQASPTWSTITVVAWQTGKAIYFAGLGLGFMLVEVCLAQKLILYLGYPTLSLAVILFALLLGAGLG